MIFRIGCLASLLLIRRIAPFTPGVVLLGGSKATETVIDAPGAIVAGSVGCETMSKSEPSGPLSEMPSAGSAKGPLPVFLIVMRLGLERAPPRTSL